MFGQKIHEYSILSHYGNKPNKGYPIKLFIAPFCASALVYLIICQYPATFATEILDTSKINHSLYKIQTMDKWGHGHDMGQNLPPNLLNV